MVRALSVCFQAIFLLQPSRRVTICFIFLFYITTSSNIISTKPMAKPMVLRLEC
jgi:hypothetical protein